MRRFLLALVSSLSLACAPSGDPPLLKETPPEPFPDAGTDAGEALGDADRAKLDAYLKASFEAHGWPNLAVGITFGDDLVYVKGFGTKSGANGATDVDGNTVFRVGSVTKLFTGLAILQLRDAGFLDLDDPVERHVPELASLVSPPGGPKVTIRHLVTHTSGIPSIGDGTAAYWKGDHDVTESELLGALSRSKLQFTPGTRVAYSNFAVALAGLVVARVSGEAYRDRLEGEVFEPLDVVDAAWSSADVPEGTRAAGRELDVDGWTKKGPEWRLGAAEAAGGLFLSIESLARFVAFESRARTDLDDLDVVLVRESLEESQTADRKVSSPFGVGWLTGEDDLGAFVTHDGSVGSYGASVLLYPERRAGIVAAIGAGDAGELDCVVHEALASVLERREPKTCTPSLGSANQTALDRVRALIAAPDAAGVDAAFASEFPVSRADLLAFFEGLHATYGTCDDTTVLATDDAGTARVRLGCEKGNAGVLLTADPATTRLVGLLVAPAK